LDYSVGYLLFIASIARFNPFEKNQAPWGEAEFQDNSELLEVSLASD